MRLILRCTLESGNYGKFAWFSVIWDILKQIGQLSNYKLYFSKRKLLPINNLEKNCLKTHHLGRRINGSNMYFFSCFKMFLFFFRHKTGDIIRCRWKNLWAPRSICHMTFMNVFFLCWKMSCCWSWIEYLKKRNQSYLSKTKAYLMMLQWCTVRILVMAIIWFPPARTKLMPQEKTSRQPKQSYFWLHSLRSGHYYLIVRHCGNMSCVGTNKAVAHPQDRSGFNDLDKYFK